MRTAGVPSLMILETPYQRWGFFVAPRFFVALPVRMPGTPIRPSETNRPAGFGESGCQAPPRDAPSGSAVGRRARRSQCVEVNAGGPLPWPLMTVTAHCFQPPSLNAAAASRASVRGSGSGHSIPHTPNHTSYQGGRLGISPYSPRSPRAAWGEGRVRVRRARGWSAASW